MPGHHTHTRPREPSLVAQHRESDHHQGQYHHSGGNHTAQSPQHTHTATSGTDLDPATRIHRPPTHAASATPGPAVREARCVRGPAHAKITGTPVAFPVSFSNCTGSVVNSPRRMVLFAPW